MKQLTKQNLNINKIINCKSCGEQKEHHAKEMCFNCYRKQLPPKIVKCKNCERMMKHKAFGLCSTCHTKLHHYDKTKAYNYRKYHNISLDLYRKKTQKCIICGFDKMVELHHLDKNRKNNEEKNLIGLCPNHHKMLHDFRFSKEIKEKIKNI